MKKKCVLASQSPRRRELMTMLGIPFNVVPSNVDETLDASLTLEQQIETIAFRKADHVYKDNQDKVVIGADTVVVLDGEIYGKPKTPERAIEMLRALSGKTHYTLTGVSIISSETQVRFTIRTNVTFYTLTDSEIQAYVDTKEPLDKAGSYSIQGLGGLFVSHIEGDFYSVVGLPIAAINRELKANEW